MHAWLVLAALAGLAHHADAGGGCHEVSKVVGYERCAEFGSWSRDEPTDPWRLELGSLREELVARPLTLEKGAFDATIDGLATRWLTGTRLFYAGLELEAGSVASTPGVTGSQGAALGVAGIHASLWRFAAGFELDAGGQLATYTYMQVDHHQGDGLVEARAHVEWFATAHYSFGVAYGHSLVDADAHLLYVYAGVHFRAFDGMY